MGRDGENMSYWSWTMSEPGEETRRSSVSYELKIGMRREGGLYRLERKEI